MADEIIRFESSAALAARYCEVRPEWQQYRSRSSWTNESTVDAVTYAQTGREHLVPAAQALIDKIENAGIELDWPKWQDAIAGSFPNVPAYLAGRPDTMRAKIMQPNDRAPIRVYADLTTSGGIDHEKLTRRGTAMLALAMLLSQQRPVELFAVIGLNRHGNGAALATVRIPAAPLELATACYVLTSAAFPRDLGYQILMRAHGSGGDWPWNLHPFGSNKPRFVERMRAALGMAPADLYLAPPHYDGRHEPIIADPIRWINDELRRLGAQQAQPEAA